MLSPTSRTVFAEMSWLILCSASFFKFLPNRLGVLGLKLGLVLVVFFL